MKTHSEYKALVEKMLSELLTAPEGFIKGCVPELQMESMRYSVEAGGKRLRPCMLLAACDMLGGDIEKALPYACAIEMIHTYSLIHDDLPGMDNDTLRRGRKTNHVVYGVGQAILAGDGLLNYAFEVMLKAMLETPGSMACGVRAMNEIAIGAGVTGMVAGQCADLYAENNRIDSEDLLDFIHEGKTMAMFMGAVMAGAQLADADEAHKNALKAYARAFGHLFQVTDDILDITADAEKFGKSKGKDEKSGKLTAVSNMTLEGAQARARELRDEALEALAVFGDEADYFRVLVNDMYIRTH